MEVIRFDIRHLPERKEGLALALGTFDGFHKGHQKLLVEARFHAPAHSGALLFSASPAEVLSGSKQSVLMGLDDKIRFLNRMGVDYAYVVEANQDFFALSKEQFVEDVLSNLGVELAVVGEDYRFGRGGEGDADWLSSKLKTRVIPLLKEGEEKISSSAIKEAIARGDIAKANSMLGRAYEIHGKVVKGFQNGTKIGFPTANIDLDCPYVLPKPGVYFGLVYIHGLPHRSIVNVGCNPTVGLLKQAIVEAHLLDFEGDVYGKTAYVQFLAFRREERKFANLDELKEQLQLDRQWARLQSEDIALR